MKKKKIHLENMNSMGYTFSLLFSVCTNSIVEICGCSLLFRRKVTCQILYMFSYKETDKVKWTGEREQVERDERKIFSEKFSL